MDLDNCPSYVLTRLSNQINLRIDRVVRQVLSISATEWRILSGVASHPGTTQLQLIKLVALDRSVVSRGVQGLIDKGLIERKKDAQDARKNSLNFTREGQRFYRKHEPMAEKGEATLLSGFNEKEQKMLFELLAKISANVDKVGAE